MNTPNENDEKLIIFDCNGVLRPFSWPGIFQAYKDICVRFGIKISDFFVEDNLENFRYVHTHDLRYDFSCIGLDEKDFPLVYEIFHLTYDRYVDIFPWVEPALRELSSKAVIAVLSNSTKSSLENTFNGTGRYVSMLVGSDQASKSDAKGVKMIMDQFGIAPENTCIIGDTAVDIEIGKEAGIETIAVAWGATQSRGYLRDLKADVLFRRPEDLMQYLRN